MDSDKFPDIGVLDEMPNVIQRENFALSHSQETSHVFSSNFESTPRETGHDLITRISVFGTGVGD